MKPTRPASGKGSVVIIGAGRAGGSFQQALLATGQEATLLHHDESLSSTRDADLVLLCVPDASIEGVASAVRNQLAADATTVLAHVAGSQPLGVLGNYAHGASVHPLMSLPDPETGGRRLRDSCTFAVDGRSEHARRTIEDLIERLGGSSFAVTDDARLAYHAAATVAANHLTALCGQVEALAALVGIPPAAYWNLMQTTLDNIRATSPADALTGPAARGDWGTVAGHLQALPADEVDAYRSLARRASRLAGRTWPDELDEAPTQ